MPDKRKNSRVGGGWQKERGGKKKNDNKILGSKKA
jgi:hypothetical protein